MKSFLFGLAIGIGLGVLFAPMSGEDIREDLTERAGNLADSARQSYAHGCQRIQRRVEEVKSTAGRVFHQPRTGTEYSF